VLTSGTWTLAESGKFDQVDVHRLRSGIDDVAVDVELVAHLVRCTDVEVDRALAGKIADDGQHVIGHAIDECDHAVVVDRRRVAHLEHVRRTGHRDPAEIVERVAAGVSAEANHGVVHENRAAVDDVVIAGAEVGLTDRVPEAAGCIVQAVVQVAGQDGTDDRSAVPQLGPVATR
jgi:hypothetical protein